MKINIARSFPNSAEDLDVEKIYSFINLFSISTVINSEKLSNSSFVYFCDGISTSLLLTLIMGRKVNRVSFDFTSIAHNILKYSTVHSKSIYFIGGTPAESESFQSKMLTKYSNNLLIQCRSGYWQKKDHIELLESILSRNPDIVVAGLGSGLQEDFLYDLRAANYKGLCFTCGGFIRQESYGEHNYYPYYIDKLNLRFIYRAYKEPHTFKRYIIDYPYNLIKVIFLYALKKVQFEDYTK